MKYYHVKFSEIEKLLKPLYTEGVAALTSSDRIERLRVYEKTYEETILDEETHSSSGSNEKTDKTEYTVNSIHTEEQETHLSKDFQTDKSFPVNEQEVSNREKRKSRNHTLGAIKGFFHIGHKKHSTDTKDKSLTDEKTKKKSTSKKK